MADIDDDIDRLYQGPLDAFTDARNALAKAAKRADVKTLAKPSLPAWAVNQLHWQHREVVDRLEDAAEAVRAAHQQALAGGKADIAAAEQAHREVLREAVAVAKDVLNTGGHPITAATLEAVRETLAALPSPEANGRLIRPLAARGLEALAGLVLAARVPGPVATRAAGPAAARESSHTAATPAARPVASRPTAVPPATKPAADSARAKAHRERESAREQALKEREANRHKAEAALAEAREALATADAAVEQAERDLASRQSERIAARNAVKTAQRSVEELSFGR